MTSREKPFITCFGASLVPLFVGLLLVGCQGEQAARRDCQPTAYDEIGPFYRPNAPVRKAVGKGYILRGRVFSAVDCRPLPGARIEFWLVNPEGKYDDAHRATVYADKNGRYVFESNRPTDYINRKPHIHMMVTARDHEQLITQHYPRKGSSEGIFDLVLAPAEKR